MRHLAHLAGNGGDIVLDMLPVNKGKKTVGPVGLVPPPLHPQGCRARSLRRRGPTQGFSRRIAPTRERADLRPTRSRVGRVDGHSNNSDRGAPSLEQLQKLAALAKSAPDEVPGSEPVERWLLDRRLDDETIAEIVRRYESGVGTPQLCHEFKLSKYSVLKVLHAQGVAMRRQPLSAPARANVVRLYSDGATMSEIAERLGTGLGQVRQSLIDAGAEIHPPGRRRRA